MRRIITLSVAATLASCGASSPRVVRSAFPVVAAEYFTVALDGLQTICWRPGVVLADRGGLPESDHVGTLKSPALFRNEAGIGYAHVPATAGTHIRPGDLVLGADPVWLANQRSVLVVGDVGEPGYYPLWASDPSQAPVSFKLVSLHAGVSHAMAKRAGLRYLIRFRPAFGEVSDRYTIVGYVGRLHDLWYDGAVPPLIPGDILIFMREHQGILNPPQSCPSR
jgi:hypothetical protein